MKRFPVRGMSCGRLRRSSLRPATDRVGPLRGGYGLREAVGGVAGLLALVAVGGCAGDAPAVPATEVRDSAGVRIVTNPDVALPEWTVDSVPSVDIGTVSGEAGHDLALPWSSLRLADGRIAISNARSNELRLYQPDGSYLGASGGEGEGPGEFRLIAMLARGRGDTIVVADAMQPRLNLFGPSGGFGRTFTLDPLEDRTPRLRGLMEDTLAVYRVTVGGRRGGGPTRDTLVLAIRPLGGGTTRVLGRFSGHEGFDQLYENGGIGAWDLPFGRDAHSAVSDRMTWVGVSDSYEIRGYGRTGALATIVRLDRPVAQVDAAARERFLDDQLDGIDDPGLRPMYESFHAVVEFSASMPAFAAMRADAEGNLWVQAYRPPWEEDAATRWRVFGPDGVAEAVVTTPPGLQLHDIGPDYVMGLWLDEFDVEHIRLYRLRKDGS